MPTWLLVQSARQFTVRIRLSTSDRRVDYLSSTATFKWLLRINLARSAGSIMTEIRTVVFPTSKYLITDQ